MMSFGRFVFIAVFALMVFVPCAVAQDTSSASDNVPRFRETDLPLPRFATLRNNQVYMRAGPARRYPVNWVLTKNGMPVEIVQEFEYWRKIRTIDAEEGWVHKSQLSGKRNAMVNGTDLVPMRQDADSSSRLIARLEPLVMGELRDCEIRWCRIAIGGYTGWVERKYLWGVYESEELH